MKIDLPLLAQVGAGIVGLLGAIYQLRQLYELSRSSLKIDLDILALLEKNGVSHTLAKEYVEKKVGRIYGKRQKEFDVYSYGDLIFGLLLLPVFTIWTVYLVVQNGFTWWAVLTGFIAFTGLGGILNGLDPKSRKPE